MAWRLAPLVLASACGRVGFDVAVRASDAGDAAVDAGLPSGLVAWYPLDDTSFRDVISGQTGSCFGACPVVGPGHIGNALVFSNAAGECVQFPDDGRFALPQLTVAVWANQATPAVMFGYSEVAKRVDVSGSVLDSWQLEDFSTGLLQLTTNQGTTTNDTLDSPPSEIVLGTWQHLALSFDGAMLRLYIDGALRVEGSSGALAYDSHEIILGCDDNAGVAEVYDGALDELQVYNRALSDAEIAQLAAR